MRSRPSLRNSDLELGLRPVSNLITVTKIKITPTKWMKSPHVDQQQKSSLKLYSIDIGLVLMSAQHKPLLLAHLHRNELYPESTAEKIQNNFLGWAFNIG